ncbi:MAG: hypothetical protein OEM49_13690 [Myxococcales bacterium]|nr:hypothetical protein [Myxococcales bacterium]MDH5305939.1 hypothetical protein [Myxococcales bacterium]MDH5566393.1 hypothetical protein [Myxococcales bacterium]
MLPDPLHPAVVHLPVALAMLMPLLAILALLSIRRGLLPVRTWAGIVLLQALLVGSAWLSLETGEEQEERVERVVAERHIEHHADAAQRFLALAVVGLVVCGAGLLPARPGEIARLGGAVLSFAVLAAGGYAGRAGGELVYKYGAANAYVDAQAAGAGGESADDD